MSTNQLFHKLQSLAIDFRHASPEQFQSFSPFNTWRHTLLPTFTLVSSLPTNSKKKNKPERHVLSRLNRTTHQEHSRNNHANLLTINHKQQQSNATENTKHLTGRTKAEQESIIFKVMDGPRLKVSLQLQKTETTGIHANCQTTLRHPKGSSPLVWLYMFVGGSHWVAPVLSL